MANILLIEPDNILSQVYKQALENLGHRVDRQKTAEDGVMALDKNTGRLKIDLVILELRLSLHNGFEFLYEMRSYAEWQNLPIIINTMFATDRLSGNPVIKLANIADILYKPQTSLKKLVKSVERHLVKDK
jgi:DNA-binding response OmpR family regulator